MESFNNDCFCVSLDRDALRRALEADPATQGLHGEIAEKCPHLFAALPVFVSREHVARMAEVIRAVEATAALPAYREAALAWAPAIARHDSGAVGAFMGYDFHLGAKGPRLIEINTNAGGAMLNAVLGRAQRACCDDVAALSGGPVAAADLERTFFGMFLAEWRAAGRTGSPARIAIVDDDPAAQFLYPEFRLFENLFRRYGVAAAIRSPQELAFEAGELRDAEGRIDLVYNRLTDFSLAEASHAALREAYLADAAVITPDPRAHALFADKRNLSLLTDEALLRSWDVAPASVETLRQGIAHTRIVDAKDAESLWAERRRLFFKPAAGYASKAAYRGEKITRRVWSEVLAGAYVAQELVVPSERRIGESASMKVDIRNYAYRGEVQLLAARLYQGQTTNLRTPGGGFAPVLTPALEPAIPLPCQSLAEM
jgi:hypothetical protein